MKKFVVPLCTLGCLLTLLGCPGGSGGKDSPEAAFEAVKAARKAKDLRAYWRVFDPEERTELLLDTQIDAEHRARKTPENRAAFKAIKDKHGVGEWSRVYGTLIKDEIYVDVSDMEELYVDFAMLLREEPPEPHRTKRFGELKGSFTITGDRAVGISVTYPESPVPKNYDELSPSEQELADERIQRRLEDNRGRHFETEVVFVKRNGTWYFLEFGNFTTVDEEEDDDE